MRVLALLVIVMGAMVLSGCSGGEPESTTPPASPKPGADGAMPGADGTTGADSTPKPNAAAGGGKTPELQVNPNMQGNGLQPGSAVGGK